MPQRAGRRRGNAAVELAVTLPVIVTIVFGSVEICSQIYAKQAVETAAYECARVASGAAGTDADVQARMAELLSVRGIQGGAVSTTPASIEGLSRGTPIAVLVSAPFATNSLVPAKYFGQANIQATCVMLKEL